MRVTSGEFPSLEEPIRKTDRSIDVCVYQNIPSRPHAPIGVRVHYASIPVVRGRVQSGCDFRREFRLDIGTLNTNDVRLPLDIEAEGHAKQYRQEVKERFGRRMSVDVPVTDSPLYLQWVQKQFGISPFHGMCMAMETSKGVRVLYAHMGGEANSYLNGVVIPKYNALIPKEDRVSFGRVLVSNPNQPTDSVFTYDLFFAEPR